MLNFSIDIDIHVILLKRSFIKKVFIKKTKSIRPPPLLFSWEIYEFFKIAEAAARS